jgi:hypothetical protein
MSNSHEVAKEFADLLHEAAETIDALLDATEAERTQLAAGASTISARLRATSETLTDEIFSVAMEKLKPR